MSLADLYNDNTLLTTMNKLLIGKLNCVYGKERNTKRYKESD